MLQENRLGQGYSPGRMDSRIYKQQDIVTRHETRMAKEHLRLLSWACKQEWRLSTPYLLLSRIPEICAYLIVCFYCSKGFFPVGRVIKYVGYLNRVTENVLDAFSTISYLKSNEPFLIPYMEYFKISNDMYQGSLAVEKRSDKKFDTEFRDVSFKYAGTKEYALKHINLTLKVGERLALVGMNGSGKTTFIKRRTEQTYFYVYQSPNGPIYDANTLNYHSDNDKQTLTIVLSKNKSEHT